jgi:hypothetical protein
MDSRGSSIFGRASSSEDSTCNQEDFDRSQSYQNNFFDALRKNQEIMGNKLHELKEGETTAKITSNISFRITPSSNQDCNTKESDNEDVVYIEPTASTTNNNNVVDVHSSNNPFQFGANIDKSKSTLIPEMAKITETPERKLSRDATSVTINTITNLLKQLQELSDKENELLKRADGESTRHNVKGNTTDNNANSRRSTSESRKKSRPQLLMKKMKVILSTSNLGMKTDNVDLLSEPQKSAMLQNDGENKEVSSSTKAPLKSLRLERLEMSKETLSVVDNLRANISEHMPGVVRRRAHKCSSVSPSPSINGLSTDDELPLLLGRCFNLSVNLKILRQCNFGDPAIACRVFVDFDVLENYLRQKVQECETSLNIQPSNVKNNSLCPTQLESKLQSLSMRNQNLCENEAGCR